MTEAEQSWMNYLENSYPRWLRAQIWNEDSVVFKYDYMRSFTIAMLYLLIEQQSNQLIIETATEMGLTAWEQFLKIPVLDTEPVSVRRANIRARLAGNAGTVKSIRKIIETFIPEWAVYSLEESWKVSSDPDVVWSYMVTMPTWVVSDEQYANLIDILKNIHPAHCELILNYTTMIYDAVWLSDSVAHWMHAQLAWANEWSPAGTDLQWVSESAWPLVWSIWS